MTSPSLPLEQPPASPVYSQAEAAALRKQQVLAAAEVRAESDAAAAADLHAQQIAAVTRGCERLGKEVRRLAGERGARLRYLTRSHCRMQMLERKESYKRAYTAAARKAAAYKAKLVQLHGLFLRAQADASDVSGAGARAPCV